jgi:dihydrofolate synthase/folylpolyglutamate synthase
MHNGPDMPATLVDWLIYLESLHPKTIALGLERVAQVKQRLNLEADFPVIVVGGTNGKGSVCAMLESILHAAGYRVGCYTSPHLLHYNERVRIAKQPVSDAELCASFEKIEQARNDISLTYFEFGTLAAMQCFIEHKVDVAVLEVGLGGRLDAVNVFDNDCAVIASVDIDHTDYLGDTREQIAFEKAGIMRSGKVAVCADGDVPQAVRDQARQVGAQLWCIGDEFSFTAHQGQWDFHGKSGARSSLPYPALRGTYQLHNASAALAALDALKDRLPASMGAVRRGLGEVQLAGRFQFVPGKPSLILDVAHNPHAARALAQVCPRPRILMRYFPCWRTRILRGWYRRSIRMSIPGWWRAYTRRAVRALSNLIMCWNSAGCAARLKSAKTFPMRCIMPITRQVKMIESSPSDRSIRWRK